MDHTASEVKVGRTCHNHYFYSTPKMSHSTGIGLGLLPPSWIGCRYHHESNYKSLAAQRHHPFSSSFFAVHYALKVCVISRRRSQFFDGTRWYQPPAISNYRN